MNKISETEKSKDDRSGAANAGDNKNKESKQKKRDQQSNTNSSVNINFPWSAPTVDRTVTLQLNASKTARGGATKVTSLFGW